jgi:hypothetical protein
MIGAGAGTLLLGGVLWLVGRQEPPGAEVRRDGAWTYYDLARR